MKPLEMLAWRREHKRTQTELGVALGVSRRTVHNWEHGTFAIPDDMGTRLAKLAAGEAKDTPPEIVCPATTERRYRQYALYIKHRADSYTPGPEHPRRLFPGRWRHEDLIPLSFLDTDEYRSAVVQYRSQESERPSPFRD